MNPAEAQLTHRISGRFRVKVPSRRHDAVFFDAVVQRLSQCEGVIQVRASPDTGSVLVIHSADFHAIADFAAREGLFSLRDDRDRLDAIPWSAVVPRWPSRARMPHAGNEDGDRDPRDTGARALSASLSGLGVLQALRGQFMAPAMTLFWYAYDAWRARPSTRTGASRRAK